MFQSFSPRHSFKLCALVALFAVTLVSGVVPGVQAAGGTHDGAVMKRRHGPNRLETTVEKRQGGSRFTYFKTGLGACGGNNVDSDYVVALNTPQWAGGSHCGERLTITIGGKSASATVVDRCVECPYGALDFTIGLFQHFESNLGAGTLYGSWSFGSAPEPKTTTSKETPKPTPTPMPTPTPTTTSTSKSRAKTTTSTTSSAEPTTTSEASSTVSSAAASSTAPAVAIPTTGTLDQAAFALIQLAGIVVMH